MRPRALRQRKCHADLESWPAVLRSRLRSRLRAWDRPDTVDSSEIRYEDSRTSGDASHVHGNRSRGAMGGATSLPATHTGDTAWRRVRRARLLADRGIFVRTLASGPPHWRVPGKPRPRGRNGVHRDARGFFRHAASRGSKLRSPIRSDPGGPSHPHLSGPVSWLSWLKLAVILDNNYSIC